MRKSNFIYIYQDNFLSLLNLIKYLMIKRIIPQNIKPTTYQANLFEELLQLDVPEDPDIIKNITLITSKEIVHTIYKVFLSSNQNKEILIYYFVVHSLNYKNQIFYMRNLKSVSEVLRITKYVERETHKMKGFLRFKELKGNVLYAEIEPENDIIIFLSQHFKERLKNEFWIIEDKKRGVLSIYDKNNFFLTSNKNYTLLEKELSECENDIEELWKNFYKTIAIRERTNKRCQMNFMPKKYWKYIIEMSDEYEKSS